MVLMAETPVPTVWPTLNYADARAAIAFLTTAFGFEEVLVVPNPEDDDVIEHCQMSWPEGGGVMLASAGRGDNEFSQRATGQSSTYVVTDRPAEVYKQAMAGGAELFQEMEDADYGSTGFSVTDPEGNIWSFGTYRGETR